MKKVLKSSLISLSAFALSAMPVLAQGTTTTTDTDSGVKEFFNTTLKTFIQWAGIIAGIIALAYLIYAGIKYITSAGDPGKTEEAQKQIVSAIIGLAIVVLSYAVATLALYLLTGSGNLGFDALNPLSTYTPAP